MDEKAMEAVVAEARREYFREWRRKNPDRIRAINKRYWEKQALKMMKDCNSAEEVL